MENKINKKPFIKTALLFIVTAFFYYLLLTHQSEVNSYSTRGGMFALLPIVTAFVFSLVHGNFTSNFWTIFGIEAKKQRR